LSLAEPLTDERQDEDFFTFQVIVVLDVEGDDVRLQTPRGHTQYIEPGFHTVSAKDYRKEGGNAAGGTTACFPSPPLPPHGRKKRSLTR
jgi:hypothetical protein